MTDKPSEGIPPTTAYLLGSWLCLITGAFSLNRLVLDLNQAEYRQAENLRGSVQGLFPVPEQDVGQHFFFVFCAHFP